MTASATADLREWVARRTYHADHYDWERVRELRRQAGTPVSVVLPAREVAGTIGEVVDQVMPLYASSIVDEVLVVDAASQDDTAQIAARHGARVVQEASILPEHGPVRGKGDALWRGLWATEGHVVAFVDTDTEAFDARLVLGLIGPLLEDSALQFVKGAYRRPFRLGDETVPNGGGRVTELVARPLLNLHVPQLAGFVQPLAGEFAGRRTLLESLPFPVGYGVEIGVLIDVLERVGLDAMGQCDLGERLNAHQPLGALGAMAYAVMAAIQRRVQAGRGRAPDGAFAVSSLDGLETQAVAVEERPSLASLRGRG